MAASRVEIQQVHVIDDYERVGLQSVHDQVVEGFLERQWVFAGGGFNKLFHVQESAAELLLELSQKSGLAAAGAAPYAQNGADLNAGQQRIKRSLLSRT